MLLPEKNNNSYFLSVVVLAKILFPHRKNPPTKTTQNKPAQQHKKQTFSSPERFQNLTKSI